MIEIFPTQNENKNVLFLSLHHHQTPDMPTHTDTYMRTRRDAHTHINIECTAPYFKGDKFLLGYIPFKVISSHRF